MGRRRRRQGRPPSQLDDLSGASGPPPVTRAGAASPADRWRNLDARGTRQRGSVLLLVPAGVLVLIILGAIAVDFAIAFSSQRALSSLAAAVANDAATAALSDERFYRGSAADAEGPAGGSDVEIDPVAARRLAQEAVARRAPRGIGNISVDALTAGRQVCVRIRGDVEYVFSRAVPGAADGTTVEASAVATAVEGETGTAVQTSAIC